MNGNVSFVFSEDGGSVTTQNMTGGSYNGDGTYYFIKERGGDDEGTAKAQAIYQFTGGDIPNDLDVVGKSPVYGLMLSNNDNEIVRSTARVNTKEPYWLGTGSATCYRTNILGKEFALRPDVSYQYRNTNKQIVDGSGPGMELNKYKVSADGRTITLTTSKYQSVDTSTTKYTYVGNELINTDTLKGKYSANGNTYTFVYDVTNGTLKRDNQVVGKLNYSDGGPAFILRVRGKKYVQQFNGYTGTYTFDQFGTITYYEPKVSFFGREKNYTYYFAQQDAGDRAVYYQQAAVYWGYRLADNDRTLYCTGSSWASPSTTPTKDITSNKSTLQ